MSGVTRPRPDQGVRRGRGRPPHKAKPLVRPLSLLVEEAFRTSGKGLDAAQLAEMRERLGHDFSRVRVHRDVEAAASLNAQAFTIGQDVFFAPGAYAPATFAGRDLLAHELVHTIQHGPARRDAPWALSRRGDALEHEADRASQWARGKAGSPLPIVPATAAPGLISRKEAVEVPPQGAGEALNARAEALAAQLHADPDDKTGRVRRQLNRLEDKTRAQLLDLIQQRVTGAQWTRLQQLLRESLPAETEVDTVTAPAPELSPALPGAETPEVPASPEAKAPAEEKKPEEKPQKPPEEALAQDPGPEGDPKKAPVDTQHAEEEAKKKGEQPPTVAPEKKPPAAAGGAAPTPAAPAAEAAPAPAATEAVPEAVAGPEEAAPVEAAPVEPQESAPAEAAENAEPGTAEGEAPAAAPESPEASAPEQTAETAAEPPAVAEIPDPASEEKEPETSAAASTVPPEPAAAPPPVALGGGGAALPAPEPAPEETPEPEEPEEAPAAVDDAVTGTEPPPPAPTPEGQAAPQQGATCEGGGGGAPGAEAEGGEGGGACGAGGGGGGAAEEQPAPAAPDVSQSDPAAAMGAVANLPPMQLQSGLGGVTSAASNAVQQQKEELKANPPSIDRPSGVPAQRDPSLPVTPPPLPAANDPTSVARAEAGAAIPVAQPEPLPAAPAPPTQGLKGPQLPGEAQMTEADTARAQAAVDNLPTSDPALNVTAGDPPKLELAGDADPQQTKEQQANLDQSTADAHQQGQQDVGAPMGENNIYPTVPPEKLEAKTEGEGPGALGSLAACAKGGSKELAKAQGGGGAADADEAVSIVAKEQKGDEIRGAVAKAQGDMQAKQEENAGKIAEEKTKSQEAIDDAIQENAGAQKDERSAARKESIKVRGEWNQEQATLVGDAEKDSAKASGDAYKQIGDQQKSADSEAAGQITDGNKKAADARRDAEGEAREKKKDAKKESGGFFSWLSSKVTSFFNKIKEAIQTVFEAARKLVRQAIEAAKKLAVAAIEKARKFVVDVIKKAGDVLIAIGDRVLAGFPKLRDKFRKAVKERVDKAVDAVNKLADDLKKGVQKLLDALGSAINGLLGLLECAYMAAVDVVASVVKGAIDAAKAFIDALAVFGVLIKDIAANPGQWISNLGRAVVDGIKNCLWSAFKSAVKNWFNQKLEEVLGLGLAIWNLLFKGCMKMKDIAKMAWEGLISAIPVILIQLLIEKLVSMIVPAAGAILTIIEGLRAAWGTVSRIIAAIGLFIAFLKAVKGGNAAGPFASALAAAGVVLIDFVANWLLQRLRKPAGAISGRLKAFAQKIASGLKKGLGAVKRGAKAAVGAIRKGAAAVGRAIKRGVKAVGRGLKKVGKAIAKSKVFKAIAKSKIGRAIVRAGQSIKGLYGKGKQKFQDAKAKLKAKWEKWKQEREKRKAERRAKAEAETRRALEKLLARGNVGSLAFRARVAYLRIRWGWKSLSVIQTGPGEFAVDGSMSPGKRIVGSIRENMQVLSMTPVKVKGGQNRLFIGQEQVRAAGTEQSLSRFRMAGVPSLEKVPGEKPAWEHFEEAAKHQFGTVTAPGERIPRGRIRAPRLESEWQTGAGGRKSGFFKPERMGTREDPRGKVEMISLMEATLQADMAAEGKFTTGGGRKRGQLKGYLSGLKLELAKLRETKQRARRVEIHIHYFSPEAPDPLTKAQIEQELAEAGIPNVTLFWRIMS